MGGRGDAAGRSAADRAPRRQDRDHAADRAGVHLAARRYPQCRSRHRTRPRDPRRYARQAIGRIAESAGRADTESGAARDHRRRRDRQERRLARGGSTGGDARLSGLPVVDALRRPFPVRKLLLHGRAGAHSEIGPRGAFSLRSHHRTRRRSAANVGLQRDRSAAGRAFDRAGRTGRLGSRQELQRRDRAESGREGDPARIGAGAEGGRRRRARSRARSMDWQRWPRRTGRRSARCWSTRYPGPAIVRRSIRTGWRCRWSRRCPKTQSWSTRA